MLEMLEKLCAAAGVSGAETAAAETARELLSRYASGASVDKFGCVHGFIGSRDN